MSPFRIVALVVGLALFTAVAAANGIMALGLGFTHPLMVLWVLVLTPLVFLLLVLRPPRRRVIRIFGSSCLGVAVLLTVVLWAVGWYFSDVLKDGALVPDHTPPEYDLEVGAIGEDRLTLYPTSEAEPDGPWTRGGIWGLERVDGYDQVGRILEINDEHVVREYMPISGGLETGDPVRLDSWAFPADPLQAFGIPFREVSYSSPLGDFPAWFVDGSSNTWVVFLHGKGAEPGQALRMVPTIVELGHPFLMITYRNDVGVPPNEDGFYGYGQTEYEDLEGAVRYTLEHGAEEVVLVGYSMGGAIIAKFLHQSDLAGRVSGVILDAPMVNFNATVDLGAHQKGYPGVITTIGKAVSSYRFGVDWGALDYLKHVDELSSPILLFHGDADTTVPMETSDALAESRPDIVTYIRVPGAPHVCSWNLDPTAYEAAIHNFLVDLTR
jgi:pimeloyl-ACP methyl ester carboxylesterase